MTDRKSVGARIVAAAALGLGGAAAGQNQWVVEVLYSDPAGVINSPDDKATINLWAAWDPAQYAFQTSDLNMTADDPLDAGLWSGPHTLLRGPGSNDGTVEGESVTGIVPFQLHFPPELLANTSNPIQVWTATWQTSDLSPRGVPLLTDTVKFRLYLDFWGNSDSFIDTLVEGAGTVTIVPAPGALACLLPGAMLLSRRRRRI